MRVTACASAFSFAALAAVLAGLGAVAPGEAALASAAVALAFIPSGWWSGSGPTRISHQLPATADDESHPMGFSHFGVLDVLLSTTPRPSDRKPHWARHLADLATKPGEKSGFGRRAAEALVLPAAFALTMVGGVAMRRMLLPPLLLLAAWAVVAAAWERTPRHRWPLLAACFGLSARAAVGLGLSGFGLLQVALVILLSAAVPWATVRRWGPRSAELAALLTAVIPWQRWPLAAAGAVVLALALGVRGGNRELDRPVLNWLPGVGAALLLASSLAPWPGFSLNHVLPIEGWPAGAVLLAVLVVTTRLRPGVAGVLWFGAFVVLGPALAPTPEHRAFNLSRELGQWQAPVSTGDPYVVEATVRGAKDIAPGTPLAVLTFGGEDHALSTAAKDSRPMWRPQRGVGHRAVWRALERYAFEVPVGERPLLVRHPDLDDAVEVRIETIGSARPTPPRSWALPSWLLAAAVVVAILQLLAATWGRSIAAVPWLVLVLGALVARAPVEPLHVLGERLAPDFALAALLAAWLPAAGVWLKRGRFFAATAALLVPLALAAPQLTPPMYGDEPFHLILMESLAENHDFDVSDNLGLEEHPQNELYAPGWPLSHSPGLGLLLLPGYLVAGRTGALVLLALMGGALAALLARRARDLGVAEARVRLLVLLTAATYPLATFASQIWSELPGALAVAAMLVLAARRRGGRLGAVVVAIAAAVVKTRFALLVFPVAAAAWLRRNRLLGAVALAAAAAAVMAVGWLFMGHPFGPYRRLYHLWPSDPVLAARVLGGLVFDAAGGLLFTAPLWVAAIAGMLTLWRRGGAGERALLLGCGLTVAALLHSPEWYGGGSPPARYLVAMLPAFVLAGGMVLTRPSRWRRLGVILLPPTAVAWWALITRPHFSINPGDGGYWLADALARRFAADGRRFFPSFLVADSATVAFPLVVVGVVALVVWVVVRRPAVGVFLRRSWIAIWLTAAAGLVLAIGGLPDRVVEVEAPQVRRSGGSRVPPGGTVARYSHRRGWRLDDGDRVVVPLRLRARSEVVLEGWLLGTARRRSEFLVQWDEGDVEVLRWQGDDPPERVVLPSPPGAGRHRLTIAFTCPPEGAVVLDRIRVVPAGGVREPGDGL